MRTLVCGYVCPLKQNLSGTAPSRTNERAEAVSRLPGQVKLGTVLASFFKKVLLEDPRLRKMLVDMSSSKLPARRMHIVANRAVSTLPPFEWRRKSGWKFGDHAFSPVSGPLSGRCSVCFTDCDVNDSESSSGQAAILGFSP